MAKLAVGARDSCSVQKSCSLWLTGVDLRNQIGYGVQQSSSPGQRGVLRASFNMAISASYQCVSKPFIFIFQLIGHPMGIFSLTLVTSLAGKTSYGDLTRRKGQRQDQNTN
jgi:hypothetical protein